MAFSCWSDFQKRGSTLRRKIRLPSLEKILFFMLRVDPFWDKFGRCSTSTKLRKKKHGDASIHLKSFATFHIYEPGRVT